MPKTNKYNFYNIPKEYSPLDYKEAVEHIVKRYSGIRGLESIYIWGGTPITGISDLDFVFVFKNKNVSSMPVLKRAFYILSGKFRYIARHPFFYIDKESFENIRYVYPDAEFRLLYGDNANIKRLSQKDDYFSRAALLSDIIVRHYPRDFLEQIAVKSINARDMLLRLNSLKYSVRAMNSVAKEKNSSWNYKLEQIDRLRKKWFDKNDFDLLASLGEDAAKIGLEITERFRDFLIKKGIVEILSGSNAEYNGARNSTMFVRNWNRKKALIEMSRCITNRQMFFSMLPIELAPQQIEYSRHKGFISSYVKKRLRHDIKYRIKYSGVIRKRAMIFNNQAELAHRLKHSDFAAFFDFGYRNKSGINNTVLNFLRSYRD